VQPEKCEYHAKVHLFNLKDETIICKVRYFKPLFVIIVMIMDYRYENLCNESI